MDWKRHEGCLLGLAVGDALGFTVDDKSWEEICRDYGPNGLLGYDLVNGTAQVTGYTQLAAFTLNALLLSISRGSREYLRYTVQGLREWARNQQFHRDPEKSLCWVAKPKELRRHLNRDARMLDALRFSQLGRPDAPLNRNTGAGVLPGAVAIGMFYRPERMTPERIGALSFDAACLTHGDRETELAAAVLAYTVAGVLQHPESTLQTQVEAAMGAADRQFGEAFPQEMAQLTARLKLALQLAGQPDIPSQAAMERLGCLTAAQCLAGGIYAAVLCSGDFDVGMIAAVNHSGCSAATGAVTGALLGAALGAEALPDFYVEELDCLPWLRELAKDIQRGTVTSGLFDDDWDQKYVQGMPLNWEPPEE